MDNDTNTQATDDAVVTEETTVEATPEATPEVEETPAA